VSVFDDIMPTLETLKLYDCEPSRYLATDTGRALWRVTCRRCDNVVKTLTTNPNAWKCYCNDAT
jgi:hypothetical protein